MPGHRFYSSPENFLGNLVTLDDEEAHHALSVLRMRVGDEASVFDGSGREFAATFTELSKRRVILSLGDEMEGMFESPLNLTLAAALLKADKFEWVIQKAVELGVTRIVPLVTEYTEVGAIRAVSENRLVRWRRILLDATKQCGRRVLTDLSAPVEFEHALTKSESRVNVFFAERGALPWRSVETVPESATAFIGPEGGWSGQEMARAGEGGCCRVTLGPRILRAETASILAVGLLQSNWGDIC